jgi:hypothetical protein
MANRRDLKAYVRYDGSGRIIPGSNVLRNNEPKNGNWKEIQAYACCNNNPNCLYFTIEATEDNLDFLFQVFVVDDGGADLLVTIEWGDGDVNILTIPADDSTTINHTFPNPGLFSGTLCVDTPSRVLRIDADIND